MSLLLFILVAIEFPIIEIYHHLQDGSAHDGHLSRLHFGACTSFPVVAMTN